MNCPKRKQEFGNNLLLLLAVATRYLWQMATKNSSHSYNMILEFYQWRGEVFVSSSWNRTIATALTSNVWQKWHYTIILDHKDDMLFCFPPFGCLLLECSHYAVKKVKLAHTENPFGETKKGVPAISQHQWLDIPRWFHFPIVKNSAHISSLLSWGSDILNQTQDIPTASCPTLWCIESVNMIK